MNFFTLSEKIPGQQGMIEDDAGEVDGGSERGVVEEAEWSGFASTVSLYPMLYRAV